MDGHYIGLTQDVHTKEIVAPAGIHTFSLVDGEGTMLQFKVTFLQQEE